MTAMGTIKRARTALYCRVGQDDQFAMDLQVECMKMHAEKEGLDVAAIYCDQVPACQPRPALRDLLLDAGAGCFDVILIPSPSHLARKTEQFLVLADQMESTGVSLRFADGFEKNMIPIDPRQISSYLAQEQ